MEKYTSTSAKTRPILLAICAAALYGISAPVSKILLTEIPPTLMAALLYLGAGSGMLIVSIVSRSQKSEQKEAKIAKEDLPYVLGMVLLDIAAPIFLMIGLTMTTAENASLLNNFEIVATSLIALFAFKEAVGRRMWLAIALITFASVILTAQDLSTFTFSTGSLFVIAACACWGLENNCTRMLSLKDPAQIVVIKGFGAGLCSLFISFAWQEYSTNVLYILFALLLGFAAYGLSIFLYIKAQRELGASRTSIYYAAAPFIGVILSWALLHEKITPSFLAALVIMLIGTYFAVSERHRHFHLHPEALHDHRHSHTDGHHNHTHDYQVTGEHSHEHTHEAMQHEHPHTPDMHHKHTHID